MSVVHQEKQKGLLEEQMRRMTRMKRRGMQKRDPKDAQVPQWTLIRGENGGLTARKREIRRFWGLSIRKVLDKQKMVGVFTQLGEQAKVKKKRRSLRRSASSRALKHGGAEGREARKRARVRQKERRESRRKSSRRRRSSRQRTNPTIKEEDEEDILGLDDLLDGKVIEEGD